jgi:hypothetical protein
MPLAAPVMTAARLAAKAGWLVIEPSSGMDTGAAPHVPAAFRNAPGARF